MKKKILVIFVMTLLITTVIQAIGTNQQFEEKLDINTMIEPCPNHQSANIKTIEVTSTNNNNIKTFNVGGTPFYAYMVYDPYQILTIGPCKFLPTSPGTITSLAPTSSNDFLSGGTWIKGEWWGCEFALGGGNTYMWKINPISGVMTYLFDYNPTGIIDSYNGISYDPITDRLLGCTTKGLFLINKITGSPEYLGDFTEDVLMIDIAFDKNGNLYGEDILGDKLYFNRFL